MTKTRSLIRLFAIALASGALLASPAARAFTVEDGKGNTVPKFDLDQQSRQFRKPDLNLSTPDKKGIDTPFGTLQFGVGQNSPFSSPFGSSGISNANREHYNRMFTPENLQGGRRD